jgi:hypothetical protein
MDQIVIATSASCFPQKAFEYANKIAQAFEKEICLISLDDNPKIANYAAEFQKQTPIKVHYLEGNKAKSFTETLEEKEASMVIFELSAKKPFNNISYLLKISRQLRLPYIFVKENFREINFNKILVPISFLVEEKEKGRFASGFGRFLKSEITLLVANDYGSKAQSNANAIKTLLDKFDLKYEQVKANKNSSKVEMEAVETASNYSADVVVLITASREYGLDDILFGPKELHIIRKATIPLMLLNPRGDLYALCW